MSLEEKDEVVTHLVNHGGVCTAGPGIAFVFLKIVLMFNSIINKPSLDLCV